MGEASAMQLQIDAVEETNGGGSSRHSTTDVTARHRRHRSYTWWLLIGAYSFFILTGVSVATLLSRLYYEKGGKSRWLVTLVQTAGFPVLIPLYFLPKHKTPQNRAAADEANNYNLVLSVSALYVALGVILAALSLLYSVGISYLPASVFSLTCSSTQLAFTAFFSFFINSQKFNPFIINSIVLLTLSSTLLAFQNNPTSAESAKANSQGKYIIGFICTVAGSAAYGLQLSLTQFCFKKVLKRQTFKVVLDMIIYPSLVAVSIIVVGLFASGEWKTLGGEMRGFELGEASYVNTLVWTAISLQVFSIGSVGLIFEVSSLFSNVIGTLALPIVPVLATLVFHDKISGVKVVSILLAIWGFVSYVYQHYLEDQKHNAMPTEKV